MLYYENRNFPTTFVENLPHRLKIPVQKRFRGCNRKVDFWLYYRSVRVKIETAEQSSLKYPVSDLKELVTGFDTALGRRTRGVT
jgi:hypothetical protein